MLEHRRLLIGINDIFPFCSSDAFCSWLAASCQPPRDDYSRARDLRSRFQGRCIWLFKDFLQNISQRPSDSRRWEGCSADQRANFL